MSGGVDEETRRRPRSTEHLGRRELAVQKDERVKVLVAGARSVAGRDDDKPGAVAVDGSLPRDEVLVHRAAVSAARVPEDEQGRSPLQLGEFHGRAVE